MDKAILIDLAGAFSWKTVADQPANGMVSFRRGRVRINVYTSTGTVGICMDGAQTFRRGMTIEKLEPILANPYKNK